MKDRSLGARRGRPRTSDILQVPKGALKQIKEIAQEARIPIDQVFADVVENGLLTVRDMYSSLITFRQNRAKLNEQEPNDGVPEVTGETDQQPGEAYPVPDSDFLSEFEGEGSAQNGSVPLIERSGLVTGQEIDGVPIESDVI